MKDLPALATLALLAPCLVPFFAPCPAAASGGWRPSLKWYSASSSLTMEHWGGTGGEGNGPSWKARDVLYNPPQTLAYLHLGAGMALHPRAVLSASVPFFRNSIEPYTSSRSGLSLPGRSVTGTGDIEFALALRLGARSMRASFAAPWAYTPEFLEPWSGLGVYRAGLGASSSHGPHAYWAAADGVVLTPRGEMPGLVEPLDFALKGGYAFSRPLFGRLTAKAGIEGSFTSYSWSGDEPQHNYSLDPRLVLSFAPRPGHAVSVSASATLYSYQGGSRTYHTYASRRIGLSLQYGRYL